MSFRRQFRRRHWQLWFLLACLLLSFYMWWSGQEEDDEAIDPIAGHFTPRDEIRDKPAAAYRWDRYRKRNEVRSGAGEMGQAVKLSAEEQKITDQNFAKEGFNKLASNKIALDRTLPDLRHPDCRSVVFDTQRLPTASVVVIFINEQWSSLLRTVHSVVNRSPPSLLHELILVDDTSDFDFLGQPLDDYVQQQFPDKVVWIHRLKNRAGLIRARLEGAKLATGDVLIFLDSHCEATEGWLEPLLARIAEDRTAVLCPTIDTISDQDLAFHGSPSGVDNVGGFTWSMHFTWIPVPDYEKHRVGSDVTVPVRSATMAGGLFAVERNYFFEVGGYDEGMGVWGGENLEISFRVWQCGGKLEFLACSHVGHIFRSSHPYSFPGNLDYHGINSKRVAEVWMDDYKRLFYNYRHDLKSRDVGDLSERKALRQKLKCKSFSWFLDTVYREKFIVDDPKWARAWGMLQWSRSDGSLLCLDIMSGDEHHPFQQGVYFCQQGQSANQVFSLSVSGEVRREEGCLLGEGNKVSYSPWCRGQAEQKWTYSTADGLLKHVQSGKCMDASELTSGSMLKLSTCQPHMTWKWQVVLDASL